MEGDSREEAGTGDFRHSDSDEVSGRSDAKDEDQVSDDSIFFPGQIPGAISAAKSEQKNLIIYISGENEECRRLDQSTWQDPKIRQLLLQNFVTLRLLHGTKDAAHFAAMYPYQQVPTIAIISHNGKLLKQHGSNVSAEDFLQSLQSAIMMQNAAAVVAAALASTSAGSCPPPAQVEDQVHGAPTSGTSESRQECVEKPPPSGLSQSKQEGNPVHKVPFTGQECSSVPDDVNGSSSSTASPTSNIISSEASKHHEEQSYPREENIVAMEPREENTVAIESSPALPLNEELSESKNSTSDDCRGKVTTSNLSVEKAMQDRRNPDTIHLQIRLTNGENIRSTFNSTDSLATVKEFIDNNRTDGKSRYSLAILYPKQSLGEEDMKKSLSELRLENRATLMLIGSQPKKTKVPSVTQGGQSSTSQVAPAENGGGIWKILSYLNPFSYFASSRNGNNDDGSNWQYEPDPRLRESMRQNSGRQVGRPDTFKEESSKDGAQNNRNWGGNIHTLQHDEDDNALKRGNAFWNGNSTQYGGDESKK